MKILGVLIIVCVYGVFQTFARVFSDDDDRQMFGFKIVVAGLCGMMLFAALSLILGGTS